MDYSVAVPGFHPMSDPGPLRDGGLLVVPDGTVLPARCPVCNAAASVGPVIFRLGSMFSEETAVAVRVFLCDEHAARLRQVTTCAWASMLAGLAGLLISAALPLDSATNSIVAVVSLMVVLVGVVVRIGMAFGALRTFFRGRRSVDRLVWIDGMCPEFLASFPELKRTEAPFDGPSPTAP